MRRLFPPLGLAAVSALLASAPAAVVAQSPVIVSVGATPAAQVAPGGKIAIPMVVTPSSGGNIASLSAQLNWTPGRMTLDSVVAAGFGTLTTNTADAANGKAALSLFTTTGATTRTTVATLYFTAQPTIGGTRVALNGVSGGTDAGVALGTALQSRGLDVCVVPISKWGDVNGDTVVNILDAQQVSRLAVALPIVNSLFMNNAGDVNADGAVNIIDAQQIARASIGLPTTTRTGTPAGIIPAISSVAVTPASQSLSVGQVLALAPSVRDSLGAPLAGCVRQSWSSSDPSKATVDSTGIVTAVGNGTTTITMTAAGRTAQASLAIGAAPAQGIRVAVTSPVPVRGYLAWSIAMDSSSKATFTSLATTARSATIDLPAAAAGTYLYRIAAIDSLSGDTLSPRVAATGSMTGVPVVLGSLTPSNLTLAVPSISITPSSTTPTAAGVAPTIGWTINDPSGLFTDQLTTAYCGAVRYRMNAPWTADENPENALATYYVRSADCPQASNLSSYTTHLPTATQSGRMYWQVLQQATVPGSTLTPVLYGPRLAYGDTLASTVITAPQQGIAVNFTAPVAGTRYVAQVTGTSLSNTITKVLDTTAVSAGVLTIPTPVGTGYAVRIVGIDVRDTTKVTVISAATATNLAVTAGAITTSSVTLAPITFNLSTTPTTAVVGDKIKITWTLTEPTGILGLGGTVFYSSAPFTRDDDGTELAIAGSYASGQWRYTALIPAQLAAGAIYYQVRSGPTYVTGDGTVRLMPHAPSLAAGDTLRRITVGAVTQGVTINVTSPVAASRFLVMVDSGGLVAAGLPARTSFLRQGNFARSAALTIPLPVGTGYRIRVLVVDSASAYPETQPLITAGIRISGIAVTANTVTTVAATALSESVALSVPTTATSGSKVTANITLTDPAEFFDLRFFTAGLTSTSCYPYVVIQPGTFSYDRTGTSAFSGCAFGALTGTTLTGTVAIPMPSDSVLLSAQVATTGPYSTLYGPDNASLGITPWLIGTSLQLGQTPPVIAVGRSPQAFRVTVNSPVAASKFVTVLDGGALTTPYVQVQQTSNPTNALTYDVPAAVGTSYRLRIAVIDSRDAAGRRVIAGGSVTGLALTANNLTGLTLSATAVVVTDTTAATQQVGNPLAFAWKMFDPSDLLSTGALSGCAYFQTSNLTTDLSSTTAACGSVTAAASGHVVAYAPIATTPSTIPTAATNIFYQTTVGTCFSGSASGTVCLNVTAPFIGAGESQKVIAVAQPTQGLTLNITNANAASQYYVVVDSGGLAAPLGFARTVALSTTASLKIPVAVGSGYRVRVMTVDSAATLPLSYPTIRAGMRLSGVSVTANALTTLAVTTQPTRLVLTTPTTVTAAQGIPFALALKDPSEFIAVASYCGTAYTSMTPFTTDAGGTAVNVCKAYTRVTKDSLTMLDTLAAQGAAGTLYMQGRTYGGSFTAGGLTIYPSVYAPSLARGEALKTVSVTSVTSAISVSITSPAARRYYVSVDSGGLLNPINQIINGAGMTSGTVTIPTPPGTGYRVRVAAADSVPGTFSTFTSGVLATGVTSGVTVSAGATTPVSVAATAFTTVTSAPATAVNKSPHITVTMTDAGRWLSEYSHCGGILTSATKFTAVSTSSSTCVSQQIVSSTVSRFVIDPPAPTAVGSLYVESYTYHQFRSAAGDVGFYFFAPALYRGAANDSVRIVTPTAIAVNAGNAQSASVTSAVSITPSVRVTDATGTPVAGVTVTFAVASGGGSITGATAISDSLGTATVGSWTLGTVVGSNTLTATAAGLTGSPVTFTATGTAIEGITLNITNPNGASQYYVVVDSGGLTSPLNFARTVPLAKTASLVLSVPAGSGYRVRVMTVDSLSTSPLSFPTIRAGKRLSGVAVTANATTTVAVTTQAMNLTLTAPTSVTAAQGVAVTLGLRDPSEWFVTPNFCGVVFASMTAFTTDGTAGYNSICRAQTVIGRDSMTVLDTLPPQGAAGTLYMQGHFYAPSLTIGTSTVYPRIYSPSKERSEALRAVSVTALTSAITVSITSPAARRYFVAVDSGGLTNPLVQVINGTAMTSGTVTIPAPPGTGYRVRVAAVDSVPGAYPNFVNGVLASGALSGVTVASGTTTPVSVAATAVSAVTYAPVTAVNTTPRVSVTVTDPGRWMSEYLHCGYGTTSTTKFTAVATSGPNCNAQQTISPTVVKFNATLATATTTGALYIESETYHYLRAPSGETGFYYFAPALYRGAANDSIRIVTPTAIAVLAGNTQSASVASAVSIKPSVRVTDATGTPVAGVTVTFAVATGAGSITGATAVSDSTGTSTVGSWTLGTAVGSNTLTATAAGLTGSPVTFTATGTAGAATQLLVVTSASGAAAGSAFTTQPVIQLKDVYGNITTQGTITMTVSAGATVVGTSTVAAASGFTNVGITGTADTSYTLTFTSGSNFATRSITVTAGPAAQLAFSQQAFGVTLGSPFSIQPFIDVQDIGGNFLGSATGYVTISVNNGASLIGTTTTSVTSGGAAFTGIGLSGGTAPGTYTLSYKWTDSSGNVIGSFPVLTQSIVVAAP